MKDILLKDVTIIDPEGKHHRHKRNILIHNGQIKSISESIIDTTEDTECIEGDGLYISKGWMDLRAHFCDPGLEHKEDLKSGMEAAAWGGFTDVVLRPDTEPRISSKSQVEYILQKAGQNIVNLHPMAGFNTEKEGSTLSEMHDLIQAGAKGFSSGAYSIPDHAFLLQGLKYASVLKKPITLLAESKAIAGQGQIHEGEMSVQLGLVGIPTLAEEMELNAIISLARYSGTPVHISCVSSQKGVALIEQAQAEGLPITADISIQHLLFSDQDLSTFNTALKVRPPIRSLIDQAYLKDVLGRNKNFTVVSDHSPHEDDSKRCEFEKASHGASAIQTMFPALVNSFGIDKLDFIIALLTSRPRTLMQMPNEYITEGTEARLTVFSPTMEWELNNESNRSKSKNNPLWNKALAGKAIAIINKGQLKRLN